MEQEWFNHPEWWFSGFLYDAIIAIMVNKTTMVVFAHVGCGWDLKVCQI
jgi:hypothetical protein